MTAKKITGSVGAVTLNSSYNYNPLYITGTVTNSNGPGVYGDASNTWTIGNYGTISSGVNVAVFLPGGGVVNNLSNGPQPAEILGRYGVVIFGNNNCTVVNTGTITGAQGAGVSLYSGGVVANGIGPADIGALIAGTGNGITIGYTVSPALVTNFGTIRAGSGAGIYLHAGSGTIINRGAITSQYGVGVDMTTGTIVNGTAASPTALIQSFYSAVETSGMATITNFGTINSTNSINATGVIMSGGGTITNGAPASTTALIEGGVGGITLQGVAGTVNNFGTVRGGVFLGAGGSVNNGSAASTSALIDGGVSYANGVPASVRNFGTISAVAAMRTGVYLEGTLVNGSNTSTAAVITGYTGVVMPNGTVTNFGSISGIGSNGSGIVLSQGRLVNGSRTSTAASITSAHNYAAFIGGSATVSNYGTIAGTGGGSIGLYEAGAAHITNGSATSRAAQITGRMGGVLVAAGGTIVNYGLIAGTGASATGLRLTGSVAATVTNGGTITGTSGTALQFSGGNDRLNVAANGTFGGTVDGGLGTDALVFTAPGTHDISNFQGFETINLAKGGSNSLALSLSNFKNVTNATITVTGGDSGNTIDGSQVTFAGDLAVLKGGAAADTLIAGVHATMTGGGGNDLFVFATPGPAGVGDVNRITDFTTGADQIAFSIMSFNLGLAGTSTPKSLPSRYLSSKTNGNFDLGPKGANERFAYNTANGQLFYDADGNGTGSSRQLVATLAGAPPLTISDLFYVT